MSNRTDNTCLLTNGVSTIIFFLPKSDYREYNLFGIDISFYVNN